MAKDDTISRLLQKRPLRCYAKPIRHDEIRCLTTVQSTNSIQLTRSVWWPNVHVNGAYIIFKYYPEVLSISTRHIQATPYHTVQEAHSTRCYVNDALVVQSAHTTHSRRSMITSVFALQYVPIYLSVLEGLSNNRMSWRKQQISKS